MRSTDFPTSERLVQVFAWLIAVGSLAGCRRPVRTVLQRSDLVCWPRNLRWSRGVGLVVGTYLRQHGLRTLERIPQSPPSPDIGRSSEWLRPCR